MDRKTILAAAGALVLTVVGGISALGVAFTGNQPAFDAAAAAASPVVVTEYVDQAGNPISGPGAVAAVDQQTVVVPVQGQANEIVRVENADGTTSAAGVAVTAAPAVNAATASAGFGGDDQYEGGDDDEYEGHDD